MSHEQAMKIMVEGKGAHFDPDVADALVELQEEFKAIAARYADSDLDMAEKARQIALIRGEPTPVTS